LRPALIEKHLFDARFELELAAKSAQRGDVLHFAGCLFRVARFMTLVLDALNRRYYLNEKEAFTESQKFPVVPAGFHSEVVSVLGEQRGTAREMEPRAARLKFVNAG
jgi:hypothetical protein